MNIKSSITLFLCLMLFMKADLFAQQIDVESYLIRMNFSDFKNQKITASCEIKMQTKGSLKTYELDLLGLDVDSIKFGTDNLSFNHVGEKLQITWPSAWTENESRSFVVYYSGKPQRDASWGGFYFSGDYAFNLGVGFTADPHNYGRVWFPCNDVFPDRAVYEFIIETTTDKRAMCNGTLQSEKVLKNGNKEYHWKMRDPIPTYLASVAVAPYEVIQNVYSGIPVSLAAVASDTVNMKKSFENLPNCIHTFTDQYGPHTFERIGFNLVPFNGGAMEHATNIAYPKFGAAGNKNYETLWAHELAHHWFGNTITCESQEHMWINEGWASFSERLFLEGMYGKERYKEDVSANHRAVLHYAHLRDGAPLPVAGIGHANTYGSHVYDKGAEVAHTLRGYIGDSAFFKAIQDLMVTYKFKTVNTTQMKEHFQKYTNKNMDAFFYHWVLNPGFPHFDIIKHSNEQVNGMYESTIEIRQRNRMAPERFDKVVLDVTIYDENWNHETHQIILSNKYRDTYKVSGKLKPAYYVLDKEERISDAITDKQIVINKSGEYNFVDALMNIKVNSISDSALVRVEHNWVSPDHYFNPSNYPVLSKERYWTVSGLWPNNFSAEATIEYNGSTPGTRYADGYLDNGLIKITEDSLVLMYRENAGMNWVEYPNYEKITRTVFDKKGQIIIKDLKKGEYAFAMYNKDLLNVKSIETPASKSNVKIYPNPTDSMVTFEWKKKKAGTLEITNSKGQVVHSYGYDKKVCKYEYDASNLQRGVYYVGLIVNNESYKLYPFFVR